MASTLQEIDLLPGVRSGVLCHLNSFHRQLEVLSRKTLVLLEVKCIGKFDFKTSGPNDPQCESLVQLCHANLATSYIQPVSVQVKLLLDFSKNRHLIYFLVLTLLSLAVKSKGWVTVVLQQYFQEENLGNSSQIFLISKYHALPKEDTHGNHEQNQLSSTTFVKKMC